MAKLIVPNEDYLESYAEAYNEYKANGVATYSFTDPNEDILAKFDNYRKGQNMTTGRVPASYFWLVDDDTFIGEISIRHRLTDALNQYGGHIGYGIRYSKQKQGYGTRMLNLALKKACGLGLDRVLITCDDDNYGSCKVIENNGGILENKAINLIDGKEVVTRRYWITLYQNAGQ